MCCQWLPFSDHLTDIPRSLCCYCVANVLAHNPPAPQLRNARAAGTSNTRFTSRRHLKYAVYVPPAPQIGNVWAAGTSNTNSTTRRHLKYAVCLTKQMEQHKNILQCCCKSWQINPPTHTAALRRRLLLCWRQDALLRSLSRGVKGQRRRAFWLFPPTSARRHRDLEVVKMVAENSARKLVALPHLLPPHRSCDHGLPRWKHANEDLACIGRSPLLS